MTFASSAFGQLRYAQETAVGAIPASGATNLRMTGPTLKAATSVVKSEEIRSDRLSTGSTRVDLNIDGGFNFELSGKEYDPFLVALLGQTGFSHFGVAGLGAIIPTSCTTAAGPPSTITAGASTTGTSIFTALAPGSWFKVIADPSATTAVKDYFADKWFKVSTTVAATATVLTLDPSTPIAAPGLGAIGAATRLSQSTIVNGSASATSGTTATSFALEYALTDITQFMTYTGMQVNSFDLSLDVGSIVKGSFGFFGRGHTIQGSTLLVGTPVVSQSLDVMNSVADVGAIYEGGTSVLSAASFIKSIKLNINNNARGQKAVGVFGNAGVAFGELALSGTLEVYMEDATYYNKWLQGTNTSLAIGMADALGNGYMVEMDKVTFNQGSMSASGRNSDTMLSLPFDAFYNAATNRGIRITRSISA